MGFKKMCSLPLCRLTVVVTKELDCLASVHSEAITDLVSYQIHDTT